MRVLSYSPSVEAYVATVNDCYDLSPDIISCTVDRRENGVSTFSIRLQNKGGKYNGVFTPMDRVTIFATKRDERSQLLTGYIQSVTGFTLYPKDFEIRGSCSLYQLQKTYWDSGLLASQQLLAKLDWQSYQDAGLSSLVRRLISNIGGWPPQNVLIDAGCPQEVIEWAREIYESHRQDYDVLMSSISSFYDMLASTNLSIIGANGKNMVSLGIHAFSDANASGTQRLVAQNAENNNGTEACVAGMCAAWVSGIYSESGLGYPGGNAIDFWDWWGDSENYQDMNAPMGSVVVGSGWPYGGSDTDNPYGHVGIVISGGRVADNMGYHRISDSVEAWASGQSANCNGRYGYIGWVWPNRVDLSKL